MTTREAVWAHITCLTLPLVIEVPVPIQDGHVVVY